MDVRHLELGHVGAVSFEQDGDRWAIVLPGAGYSSQAPLLWYARHAAFASGRCVLLVTDAYDREADPATWVAERVEAALEHVRHADPRPLLVAKSLTSLAARFAAEHDLPAVWLTPLIASAGTSVADRVLDGLRAATAPRLLVGGTADPTWDERAAMELRNAEVLSLPEADHQLEIPGDWQRSLENLRAVTDAVARFAERADRS